MNLDNRLPTYNVAYRSWRLQSPQHPPQTPPLSTLIHPAITLFSCLQHKSKAHPLVHVGLHSSNADTVRNIIANKNRKAQRPSLSVQEPRKRESHPAKRPGWHQEPPHPPHTPTLFSRLVNDRGCNLQSLHHLWMYVSMDGWTRLLKLQKPPNLLNLSLLKTLQSPEKAKKTHVEAWHTSGHQAGGNQTSG